MSVFVDYLRPAPGWKQGVSCHLWSNVSEEELHIFAAKIRLRRGWFQQHPRHPHYDLTANMRKKAVVAGAIEADRQQIEGRV